MAPEIHDVANGWFNTHSIQAPFLIQYALNHGQAAYIAEGKGVWDYVPLQTSRGCL